MLLYIYTRVLVLLPFVKTAFERAHHLEYFAIDNGKNHCWKQVDGEWVILGLGNPTEARGTVTSRSVTGKRDKV